MRLNTPIGLVKGQMSPAAQEVFERLIDGSFEINLERLVDAMLDEFYTLPDIADLTEDTENLSSRTGSLSSAR